MQIYNNSPWIPPFSEAHFLFCFRLVLHKLTLLYRSNITLKRIIKKLVLWWGGLWGAGYPPRNILFLTKLHMHLLLGEILHICENKKNSRLTFFGVAQKPKFKHKKGGGGAPRSKFKNRLPSCLSVNIYLPTL